MVTIKIIDLQFQDNARSVGAYLIESNEGLIIVDPGPASTFDRLVEGLSKEGYRPKDVNHVLLTHIHFDHAGAAWKLAENGAMVYVHPKGLQHLASPERLWNSAKQIYGADMDRLWGPMNPIPLEYLKPADDQDLLRFGSIVVKVLYTPGHAVHHNAYRVEDALFSGDVAGIKIGKGPVMPPCPPPDIDLVQWKRSIEKLRGENCTTLYLTHFGAHHNPGQHLNELAGMLDNWAYWIKPYFDAGADAEKIAPLFMDYTQQLLLGRGVSAAMIQTYEYANPSWMSVAGLLRYWKLSSQGRLE